MLNRVNSAATSWKPVWSSLTWGLCPSRASLSHKVEPLLSLSALSTQVLWLTKTFLSDPIWGRLPEMSQEWRNYKKAWIASPSWFVNKWYNMLRLDRLTILCISCETMHSYVGWTIASLWGKLSFPVWSTDGPNPMWVTYACFGANIGYSTSDLISPVKWTRYY